jgi:hypothetical protein
MSNVVRLTPDTIAEFKAKKLITGEKYDIELPKAQFGENHIGKLNEPEIQLLMEIQRLKDTHDDLEDEELIRVNRKMAKQMGDFFNDDNIKEKISDKHRVGFIEINLSEDEKRSEEAHIMSHLETVGELKYRADYLNSMFWYNVRSRLQAFTRRMSLRDGFIIVEPK